MPRKVKIVKWEPQQEPMTYTVHYAIPNPASMAEIAVQKLQLAVLGRGCGCHTPEELTALLKDLGCEVQIEEIPGGNRNAN